MIYVTGDTHGNPYKWMEQIDPMLSAGDSIIVTGDFGIGFWKKHYWSEENFLNSLSEQAYTVLFVDGNHENFNQLNTYPVREWNAGKVHEIRKNVFHLMRGEVYQIKGMRIFTFGGGYSIDRWRRQENISWWPQEMPSKEEYEHAEQNLQKVQYQVDYILTHTAPAESVYYLSTIRQFGIKNDVIEERPLTAFLDMIQRKTTYQHWYCGHFHVDTELWRNQTVLFSSIRELTTGKIVHQWEPYEDQ